MSLNAGEKSQGGKQNPQTINYTHLPAPLARAIPGFLDGCAQLYSEHYGVWGEHAGQLAGKRVRQSRGQIRDLLSSDQSQISYAECDGDLVGYAISVAAPIDRKRWITWVTQLVVHEKFRRRNVAKTMLYSIWGDSHNFAWGLVSSNPFAVRALEKMTRRRCDPLVISKHLSDLMAFAETRIPYVANRRPTPTEPGCSYIDTKFPVDHSQVPKMIADASNEHVPWSLGPLPESHEWVAFTFSEQKQLSLTPAEIQEMLEQSDKVVRDAYSRMALDANHRWMNHTIAEVDFIVDTCGLKPGAAVLDIGCGIGRHSIELARRGYRVVGADYLLDLIKRARESAQTIGIDCVSFVHADCRYLDLEEQFDVVICLYDVIGSFVKDKDNMDLMRSIVRHLKPGGKSLVSVMNKTATLAMATNRFSLKKNPNKLLDLPSCQNMEQSGEVFDPDHFMVDTDSHVVYRREQFKRGHSLPAELVVRDRRFGKREIQNYLFSVGVSIDFARCVRSGNWLEDLEEEQSQAKEILVLCTKPTKRDSSSTPQP